MQIILNLAESPTHRSSPESWRPALYQFLLLIGIVLIMQHTLYRQHRHAVTIGLIEELFVQRCATQALRVAQPQLRCGFRAFGHLTCLVPLLRRGARPEPEVG